jgi:hypothetical protein
MEEGENSNEEGENSLNSMVIELRTRLLLRLSVRGLGG